MNSPQSSNTAAEGLPGKTQTIVVQSVPENVATDNVTVTASFLTANNPSQRKNYVEEDSTDIFVLERCSPLNDF